MDTAQLSSALAQMTGRPDDPTVRGFAQLLVTALRDDDDDDEVKQRTLRHAKRRRAAMQEVAKVQRLLQNMSDRNAFLAGALGACECWGADPGCDRCAGRGAPGAYPPDPDAFAALVLPLAQRNPHLFHTLPPAAPAEASTRDTEHGGESHAGQPN